MAQLVSVAAPPAPSPTPRPSAAALDMCPRFQLVETGLLRTGFLREDDLFRWEDDGGALLPQVEAAA